MNEDFSAFLNDVPMDQQGFVLELDQFLEKKGSKRSLKTAKNGFVVSYSNPKTGKVLLNYVFRKAGVFMRIYAGGVAGYEEILNNFPDRMKNEIKKATDCKKLNGGICSPSCPAGYAFTMDGVTYKKCRLMAFFHLLNDKSNEHILRMIKEELSSF